MKLFLLAGAIVALVTSADARGNGPDAVGSVAWGPGASIVFATGQLGGTKGVFTIGPDGSGLRRLAARGITPRWSPQRDLIAFTSDSDSGLYVVRPDGTGLRKVRSNAFLMNWSPDGGRLLFGALDGGIWMIRRDGSDAVKLAKQHIEEPEGAWSPDGRSIAFMDCRVPTDRECGGRAWDVYTLRLNGPGGHRKRLTRRSIGLGCLTWAPGPTPAFTGERGAYVGNRLLFPRAQCPAWSPDGRQIAATGRRGPVVARRDGSGRHRAATLRSRLATVGHGPVWSPDGRELAFAWPTPGRDTWYRLFVAAATGGGLRRLL